MIEFSTFLENHEKDTPNIQRVKALYKASGEKDIETITKLLVDEPVWNVCPGFPDGGIYRGIDGVYGSFYASLFNHLHYLEAVPDAHIDGGDVVIVLGNYKFARKEGESFRLARFTHIWGIDTDGRIKGVWQVADSAQFIAS